MGNIILIALTVKYFVFQEKNQKLIIQWNVDEKTFYYIRA